MILMIDLITCANRHEFGLKHLFLSFFDCLNGTQSIDPPVAKSIIGKLRVCNPITSLPTERQVSVSRVL